MFMLLRKSSTNTVISIFIIILGVFITYTSGAPANPSWEEYWYSNETKYGDVITRVIEQPSWLDIFFTNKLKEQPTSKEQPAHAENIIHHQRTPPNENTIKSDTGNKRSPVDPVSPIDPSNTTGTHSGYGLLIKMALECTIITSTLRPIVSTSQYLLSTTAYYLYVYDLLAFISPYLPNSALSTTDRDIVAILGPVFTNTSHVISDYVTSFAYALCSGVVLKAIAIFVISAVLFFLTVVRFALNSATDPLTKIPLIASKSRSSVGVASSKPAEISERADVGQGDRGEAKTGTATGRRRLPLIDALGEIVLGNTSRTPSVTTHRPGDASPLDLSVSHRARLQHNMEGTGDVALSVANFCQSNLSPRSVCSADDADDADSAMCLVIDCPVHRHIHRSTNKPVTRSRMVTSDTSPYVPTAHTKRNQLKVQRQDMWRTRAEGTSVDPILSSSDLSATNARSAESVINCYDVGGVSYAEDVSNVNRDFMLNVGRKASDIRLRPTSSTSLVNQKTEKNRYRSSLTSLAPTQEASYSILSTPVTSIPFDSSTHVVKTDNTDNFTDRDHASQTTNLNSDISKVTVISAPKHSGGNVLKLNSASELAILHRQELRERLNRIAAKNNSDTMTESVSQTIHDTPAMLDDRHDVTSVRSDVTNTSSSSGTNVDSILVNTSHETDVDSILVNTSQETNIDSVLANLDIRPPTTEINNVSRKDLNSDPSTSMNDVISLPLNDTSRELTLSNDAVLVATGDANSNLITTLSNIIVTASRSLRFHGYNTDAATDAPSYATMTSRENLSSIRDVPRNAVRSSANPTLRDTGSQSSESGSTSPSRTPSFISRMTLVDPTLISSPNSTLQYFTGDVGFYTEAMFILVDYIGRRLQT